METGSAQLLALSSANNFSTIVGTAPPGVGSTTEKLLDALIGAFLPGQTVGNILNSLNDTIVPITSQNPPGSQDAATISGIVHANLCDALRSALPGLSAIVPLSCTDTGETQSPTFWSQAFWWLTGGS